MVILWYYNGIIIGFGTTLPKVDGEVDLRYDADLAREVDLYLSLHLFCQFCKDAVYILRICHRFND